ncbi:MAG: NAD-binding protein, partial [Clostridia bacterium]|nr:NAD-binding protein [Clostridia bacterium]
SAQNVETFAGGRCSLTEIKIENDSVLDNVQIAHIKKFGIKFLICAVEREGITTIPDGNYVLKGGDKVYVCASYSEQNKLFKKLNIYLNRPKYVMIVGGSKIAIYLSQMLTKTGMRVKIIEKNKDRCLILSEKLENTDILCLDGTDQEQMLQEGLATTDACISLTDLDEQNLVIAFYARSVGVHKCITKISKNTLSEMMKSIGLDSCVSPNDLTANTILQYVRAMESSFDADSVRSLYRLVNSSIEAAEFAVPSNFPAADKPLKQVKLRPQVLIACILRGSTTIIPSGDDCLKADDIVIAVSKDLILSELEDILA